MAGQSGVEYNIYDLGFGKDLIRGKIDDPEIQAPDDTVSQDPMSGSSSDSSGDFSGGLFNSVAGTTPPEAIRAGELPSKIGHGKKLFTDTVAGFLMGVDTDNIYKWIIGGTTSSADWAVTTPDTLTVTGSINVTVGGTVGGFQVGADYIRDVANSFGLASTVTGGDDVRFWAGDTFANRATAPFRITESGILVGTSVTVTGTIQATGGYIGSTTALIYEAQGINTGTTGHVRGGQTDYNTGTGYFLGYSGGAYKFSIGVGGATTNSLTWDGANLTVNGYTITSKGSFGGDGSDGALSVSSGTTTIDLGSARVVIKQYTSISITGTGVVNFSNPHANGTYVILKSQGGVTLTSSATPMLDFSALGATGGAIASASSGGTASGNNGTDGTQNLYKTNKGTGAALAAVGTAGAVPSFIYGNISQILNRYPNAFVGAGGGSGMVNNTNAGTTIFSGKGGNGGGCGIIECGGAWNFTTTNGISVVGENGGNESHSGAVNDWAAGGGGAGGGGFFLAAYNFLTANTGTVTITAAVGGNGDNGVSGTTYYGGGGGASATAAGTNGTSDTAGSSKTGGDGGVSISNILLNTLY